MLIKILQFKTNILIFFLIIYPFFYSFGSEVKKNTLSVKANEALEWFQNDKKLVAIGEVKIKIDSRNISASKVTVFYDGEINQSNILKILAEGKAFFNELDLEVYSNIIDYDFITEKIVLSGGDIKVILPNIEINSNNKLNFYKSNNFFDLLGESSIVFDKNNFLQASDIQIYLDPLNQIKTLNTSKNSFFKSLDKGIDISGEKMIYDKSLSILEVENNVIINQGNNKLNGDFAKVDIAKGISTMLSKNSGFVSGEFVNIN